MFWGFGFISVWKLICFVSFQKYNLHQTREAFPHQINSTRLTIGVFPVLVPLLVLRQPVVSLGAHGLGQVAEGFGVVQVKFLNDTTPTG